MNHDPDRDLLARTAGLPRSIEPPEDLWPEIASRIRAADSRTRGSARPWWIRAPVLAAAALVLVTLSSAITVLVVKRSAAEPTLSVAPAQTGDFRVLEAEYARAADELVGLLQRGQWKISPATRATLERNLEIIDNAINESREALARDPANNELRDMILTNYQIKLDLLRRVATVT